MADRDIVPPSLSYPIPPIRVEFDRIKSDGDFVIEVREAPSPANARGGHLA
jgi:hypothetical protein